MLNVVQSAELSSPLADTEAEGRLKIIVFVEVEMEKSVPEVDDAKVKLVDVAPLIVRNESLLLKADQSAEVRSPLADAEAEGRLNVWVELEEEIEKSVPEVEEANNCVVVVKPFNEVIPLPLPPMSSAQIIFPLELVVSFPLLARLQQFNPAMATLVPVAPKFKVLVPVTLICGLVPPKVKFPEFKTGI